VARRSSGTAAPNPYLSLLGSRLRSQLSYRASFTLELVSSAGIGLIELAEVLVIFHNVPTLAGFDVTAALLVFALSNVGFSLADLVFGQLDEIPALVRAGTLDVLLLRPLPVLAQLVLANVTLKRLGRALLSGGVLVVVLPRLPIRWTPGHVLLAASTPLAAAALFGALFTVAGAVQFFVMDGGEVANAFTYGGSYASQFPTTVIPMPLRVLYGFVIPTVFISFAPALTLLDRSLPAGWPPWLGWTSPIAAALAWAIALRAWRFGLQHYQGGGG